jgi:hypothetical protein
VRGEEALKVLCTLRTVVVGKGDKKRGRVSEGS